MPHPVCIFGPAADTREIELVLQRHGLEVLRVDDDPAAAAPSDRSIPAQALPGGRLTACTGAAGEFVLEFAQNGRALERRASALILAHPPRRVPLFARYGLRPSATVLTDPAAWRKPPESGDSRPVVVILDGLCGGSTPELARERLRLAMRLRTELKADCRYFTRDLKVAAEGVEALLQSVRSTGVVFHTFTHSSPFFEQDAQGRVRIAFTDEVSGSDLRLRPDLVVVDQALAPSDTARDLARVLGLETDAAGFPQADNVHRLPVLTNRRGVLVAGAALACGADAASDASNLLLAVQSAPNPVVAAIDPAACVRCLTCVRVCPYGAAELAGRPRVHPAACEGCGICAAECPRQAIRVPGLAPAEMRRLLDNDAKGLDPAVTVFACARSGGPALRAAAAAARWPARVTVVEVPCAGGLDREALFAAFDRGADGVMVLTCHDGNCHSRTGNRRARARVEQVQALLGWCGREGRLQLRTIAANMPAEAERALADFASGLTAGTRTTEGRDHA